MYTVLCEETGGLREGGGLGRMQFCAERRGVCAGGVQGRIQFCVKRWGGGSWTYSVLC